MLDDVETIEMKRIAGRVVGLGWIAVVRVVLSLEGSLWAQAAGDQSALKRRVEAALSELTMEEKLDLIGVVDGFYIRPEPTIGLPRLRIILVGGCRASGVVRGPVTASARIFVGGSRRTFQ